MFSNSVHTFPAQGFFSHARPRIQTAADMQGRAFQQKVDVSRGQFHQVASSKFSEQKMLDTLEKALQKQGFSLEGLKPEDVRPEKVANNILSFVERTLENNPDKINQIKTGLQNGFNEAKDLLQSMGLYKGGIKEDVESTQKLVNEGLQKLGVKQPSSVVSSQVKGVSETLQLSSTIEIKTREGDLVTFDFSKLFVNEQHEINLKSGDVSVNSYGESGSYDVRSMISVEGDLNEQEHQAIDELMEQIVKVSDDFFDGNLNLAFTKAQELGFDMNQLSGFSLDMKSEQKIEAIDIYQQVADFAPAESNAALLGTKDYLQQAVDFLRNSQEDLARSASALDIFSRPGEAFTDIFATFGKIFETQKLDSPHDYANGLIDDLANYLAPQLEKNIATSSPDIS